VQAGLSEHPMSKTDFAMEQQYPHVDKESETQTTYLGSKENKVAQKQN
jgi:hypothetical protein